MRPPLGELRRKFFRTTLTCLPCAAKWLLARAPSAWLSADPVPWFTTGTGLRLRRRERLSRVVLGLLRFGSTIRASRSRLVRAVYLNPYKYFYLETIVHQVHSDSYELVGLEYE